MRFAYAAASAALALSLAACQTTPILSKGQIVEIVVPRAGDHMDAATNASQKPK